jgi:hypothetical protein
MGKPCIPPMGHRKHTEGCVLGDTFVVPKGSPAAMRLQNSYVAQTNGTIPATNTAASCAVTPRGVMATFESPPPLTASGALPLGPSARTER